MTDIRLTNTRTRKKEPFVPLDPANVRMYLCGPTVYDRAHMGNARPVVVFDVLFRLLRHVYGTDHVTYVRNFTDVDDKINARAAATGRDIRDITEETIAWYHEDMDALGALRPTHEPRATDYIGAMITMIEGLVARGHAYVAEGHVLFDVRSYPDYGRLSGRSVDDMIAGARVEVAPFKRDPMDFVLWKPSDADLPGWDSPWGRGRPGWHIECSAMSHELLGAAFDIHAGGIDLQFPHHENEIAQSCCAHPGSGFARYWLHNEMLQVEGKKMSKSLGNFFTVRDLLDQGIPGEVIRFVYLQTHYRKPMDWTAEKAREAEKTLQKWHYICMTVRPSRSAPTEFLDALADDLNTPQALTLMRKYAKQGNAADLLACGHLVGLLEPSMGLWFDRNDHLKLGEDPRIFEITSVRERARAAGRFDLSDKLRKLLIESGVAVFDHKPTSRAFKEPDALLRYALSGANKAWEAGDKLAAEASVNLLRSAGFQISLDEDGPSAITGFDEVKFDKHYEEHMEKALLEAQRVEETLEPEADDT
ncbi:cysteine--tRNA ligase [Rhodobacter veldkampii DSM 11550]|uniref:Cysteine--tRNA ligase n=1 Tax=Phaeovulum veldkampii DSM 11550 TaxID=1185920 RepID=A0A2T4JMV9_9RHOB|nr:cysteine--tRNA ligase [Phaeovulum veldkampii]MBK5945492.1 cysteine--tRNA ligase [Phaeovulum veldkampii DSM 11550]PTE19242.1 cysteine--tRNA ligase [Phaeovulum veldkampii DSM 11550]TDQ62279.1 cysteinyl-tRNA synthetase [Phaeovulum veldkampii DSM 11550]